MIEEITICISIIIAIITLYYNIRSKNKKVISINIALIIIIVIITMIFNWLFIYKCINGYQFKAEIKNNYEILRLGCSISGNDLYFTILCFISIVLTIINIVKRKNNNYPLIKGIITIGIINFLQTVFSAMCSIWNSVPVTYTEEMIAYEITKAKYLISFGIFSNIIATNLFILINFKNKKENVSDVKGENS